MENVLRRRLKTKAAWFLGVMASFMVVIPCVVKAQEPRFTLPVDCEIGKTCFLQNLVDLDQNTPQIIDTLCGMASYDGHKGIDIRMKDLKALLAGVDILAVDDGIVLGTRNNQPDRLLKTAQDREAVRGKECGNGVALRHDDGQISQLCHLKQGSVLVKTGDQVRRGQKVGEMGLSGLTEFPHVHLSLRSDGNVLDPLTGQVANQNSCVLDQTTAPSGPFGGDVKAALIQSSKAVMSFGLAGKAFKFPQLSEGTVPGLPTVDDKVTIAWVWLLNIKKGDQVWIKIIHDGAPYAESLSDPVNRHKATYFYFTGRSRPPKAGSYEVQVELRRNGETVRRQARMFEVSASAD